ncbi:MAG: hypothetical protein IJ179_08155 [Oscillospiraceae bacterium]|nr:hypothetical protein [Oscillospiraceae bacterium]
MYSDATSKRRSRLLWLWILLALVILVLCTAVWKPGRDLSEESAAAIQEAVQRTARQCYVVEGVYPPSLSYLEENYGLQVNTKDFYVTYEAFASNLPPTVHVTSKG